MYFLLFSSNLVDVVCLHDQKIIRLDLAEEWCASSVRNSVSAI